MKWGLILILCILLSLSYVSAEDITLGVGESYTKGGVRITLARIDIDNEKIVLCVNNEKQIVNEDQLAYFKDASLEVEHIDEKYRNVEIDIDWIASCVGCKCEGACLNDECNIEEYDKFGNLIKTDEEQIVEDSFGVKETNTNPVTVENEKPNYLLITSLVIIGILLGLILIWLFWFRKMSF